MLNQVENHVVQRPGVYIQFGSKNGIVRFLRTFARLFSRHKLGIDQQAVLEVVNAECRRFAEANGAQMSRNCGSAFVCGGDRG